ncbi:LysR family transcriptional regulator [Paenibacillus anseongense]|uniref:LysR family transcriptional regulator n=1 Tax=Paenibacillus TaxID=44249 RepID=UPI002DB85F39|nr:LysR family transcriptional regulator [Paenibacillus anseongense]MEC0266368.1 LysR family transcriptional regulator [Paenibacillus anseongense]
MDSRKLQYFVEVAASCSFTKAAEKLLVAQPAISKAIQKLEEELQLKLFDRSDKSVVLTSEGNVLLAYAQSILGQLDEARREMEELRRLERGEIRIGLPSIIGSSSFAPLLKEFKKLHPKLAVTVIEEGTDHIRHLIACKEVDFGILLGLNEDAELMVVPLLTDEAVACVAEDHPLSRRRSVTMEKLLEEPLILFKEDELQRNIFLEAGKESGIAPNIAFTTNQFALLCSLVAEGMGASILLRTTSSSDERIRNVPLSPPVPVQLGIGYRRNYQLPQACAAFIDFLQRKIYDQKDVLPLFPRREAHPAKSEPLTSLRLPFC